MSLSPSARRVQGALEARGFGHLKVVELPASTRTAKEAAADPSVRPLKRDTVGKALAKLHAEVLTDRAGSAGVGGFEYRARGADATD